LDTADTSSVDGSDSDVSLLTPASSPGVSDDVVGGGAFNTITDGGDGVVKVGSAGS